VSTCHVDTFRLNTLVQTALTFIGIHPASQKINFQIIKFNAVLAFWLANQSNAFRLWRKPTTLNPMENTQEHIGPERLREAATTLLPLVAAKHWRPVSPPETVEPPSVNPEPSALKETRGPWSPLNDY
jgi:hypothetical protein